MRKNTKRGRWDVAVPIKIDFLESQPFEDVGISECETAAKILAYYGFSMDVLGMM